MKKNSYSLKGNSGYSTIIAIRQVPIFKDHRTEVGISECGQFFVLVEFSLKLISKNHYTKSARLY